MTKPWIESDLLVQFERRFPRLEPPIDSHGVPALRRFRDMPVQPNVILVQVKPKSRVSSLVRGAGGTWLAQLKAAPIEGKANAELIALVAAHFGCRKADVTIKSGASGRTKLVHIGPRLRLNT
ncbi:MAG: DUF167 domain-containing protein [Burkholderiaceae bacterium]|nr:DUF167 domain-containing protein [Burkholderiaceae bacterium]